METIASVHFCDVCFEFGIVSVINGRLAVDPCECEIERIDA
jgi:hypothetical protein